MRLLFASDYDDPMAWKHHLTSKIPALEFFLCSEDYDPATIDVALVYKPAPGLLKSLPNLRAVLSLAAGLDHLDGEHAPHTGVPVEKLVDPHLASMMAEYVLAAVMHHHREFPALQAAQAAGHWQFRTPVPIADRRVGILGLGPIGMACASLLSSVGFQVSGWSRSQKQVVNATTFAGPEGLAQIANISDILVCLLPLNAETTGIINHDLLRRLPAGAALINAGRGQHVVAHDLIAALNSDALSAATLDVLDAEPPKSKDALWRHPKIFVTPHLATFPNPVTASVIVARHLCNLSLPQPNRKTLPSGGLRVRPKS